MSKPREYWGALDDTVWADAFTTEPPENTNSEYGERFIHVIEKSAYDRQTETIQILKVKIDVLKVTTVPEHESHHKQQAIIDKLTAALEGHVGYLKHSCNRYLEANKEKIAVVKILPPINQLLEVLKEVKEMKDE